MSRVASPQHVMKIYVVRVDPKRHRLRIERPGHATVDVILETRSFLLHDFAHYAVESALETSEGFYGHLAAGVSLEALRAPERLGEERLAALMRIERQVAVLQSAFKKGTAAPSTPGVQLLRAVWGAWKKTRQGEALLLCWPGAAPEVVSAPLEEGP